MKSPFDYLRSFFGFHDYKLPHYQNQTKTKTVELQKCSKNSCSGKKQKILLKLTIEKLISKNAGLLRNLL